MFRYSGLGCMSVSAVLFLLFFPLATLDAAAEKEPVVVQTPYMAVAGPHREYADELLKLTLTLTEEEYGPYRLIQQSQETVIRRQLLELEEGRNLSVAISMPMPEWLEKTTVVPIPIMKGVASYRLFFAHQDYMSEINAVQSVEALKRFKVGQGPGWSTGKILEDNGFQVVYGGPYPTLLPMLNADRFQLLMRSAYEVEAEMAQVRQSMPDIVPVETIAVYTYLPMYFFVSKTRPQLAERIEKGLKAAYDNGQLDALFNQYFSGTLSMLNLEGRRVFYLPNTNIDAAFFERDKPYLLHSVSRENEMESQ